jgi:hypothetical protein
VSVIFLDIDPQPAGAPYADWARILDEPGEVSGPRLEEAVREPGGERVDTRARSIGVPPIVSYLP